jgi:hypothetical protein
VGDYRIALVEPCPADGRAVRVSIAGAAGGTLDLRCRGIRVESVAPAFDAPAG